MVFLTSSSLSRFYVATIDWGSRQMLVRQGVTVRHFDMPACEGSESLPPQAILLLHIHMTHTCTILYITGSQTNLHWSQSVAPAQSTALAIDSWALIILICPYGKHSAPVHGRFSGRAALMVWDSWASVQVDDDKFGTSNLHRSSSHY